NHPISATPGDARKAFRSGVNSTSSGWSQEWAQANLLAVPKEDAFDLLLFSQRNRKACPVLDVLEAGEISSNKFQGDIRQDLPRYRVYRSGELVDEPKSILDVWRDDLVSFLFGCSFS